MAPSGRTTPLSNGARRQSMLPGAAPDGSSSVKVVVRIRPNTGSDAAGVPQRFQRTVVQAVSETTVSAENTGPSTASTISTPANAAGAAKYGKTTFTFDRVVGPEEGQPQVYESAEPLVSSFLEGMNATILAYGQTSSGKSYTMGTDRFEVPDADLDDQRLGITPRAVAAIFSRLKEAQRESKGAMSFTAKVSYVEIYNEDLIDLLAGDADVRPTVQIREGKSGHIVWQGLREVKVTSAQEVMNLLAEGSTLRQTNATEMNSQSSRSHAIFSLTVTQRKWAGPGPPPSTAPSSPQSPRIGNRLSQLHRSPAVNGRSTPTADRPGSRTGLRPPSQLGRPGSPLPHDDGPATNGVESWTTLTSKFHFVDLAGSERLKRTGAVGDRAKEATSINQGLSALGNVISALGDPSKKATHVPYRDSKLTRLLQDSLGGNSRTMMVACVSPTEYNLHETRSTLTYANRAKNIRNRAEVNETEAGWDDVDYLHRTILKLRAELASIRSGDTSAMAAIAEEGGRLANGAPSSTEAELQQKVAQLTAEVAKAQSGAATSLSRDQFTAAVEPIVEEYERSLSALESQLALTRAALGHSEDEMRDLGARVDEEVKANEANSQLIDELRTRVAKLSEREATTEAYVKDLELKLKDVDEAGDAHGVAVSDLRKELTRSREQAETTELYIKELEARLAKSDDANAQLKRSIEVLERELERREEAHRELEGRVALLDTSSEQKQLLAEIDEKDRRVLELERTLDDLKTKADSAEGEAERLQKLAGQEKAAKEELESTVRTLERAAILKRSVPDTPPQTPGEGASPDVSAEKGEDEDDSPKQDDEAVVALRSQVEQLQATHADTLAELESAKAKYRDSLKEIEDLNAQVQESKLLRSQRSFSDLSDAASPASATFPSSAKKRSTDPSLDGEDDDEVEELASSRVDSRSSSPLSFRTTPRTPHARRSMPLSPGSRLSFLGARGQGASSPSPHLRSASLSQELSLAAFSQTSSPTTARPVSPSPSSRERRESLYGAPHGLSTPTATSPGERSYEQIKEEVLQLQSTLNERDAEISSLETTIQQLRTPILPSPAPGSTVDSPVVSVHLERPATPPSASADHDELNLSPRTLAAFSSIKAGLNGTGLGLVNAIPSDSAVASSPSPSAAGEDGVDQTARLDDLMRSMAQKESAHREAVEGLEEQLSALQRQHDELTVLSRDQVVNMSTEIEQLRNELEGRPEKGAVHEQLRQFEEDLRKKGEELEGERRKASESIQLAKREVLEEHERLLASTLADHEILLQRLRDEHAGALQQAALEHDDALRQQGDEHVRALEALSAEHGEALRLKEVGHESALQAKAAEADETRQREAGELQQTIQRLEGELSAASAAASSAVTAGQDDHAATTQQLKDDHATALSQRQIEHEGESERLKQEHAAVLQERDEAHSIAIDSLRKEHEAAVQDASSTHSEALEQLRAEHESATQQLRDEHEAGTRSLREEHGAALEEAASTHSSALARLRDEHDSAMLQLREQHSSVVEDLKIAHVAALAAADAEHEARAKEAAEAHAAQVDGLKQQLAAAIEESGTARTADLDSLKQEHSAAIEDLKQQNSVAVEEAAQAHTVELDNLKQQHAAELDSLRQQHSSVAEENVAAHAAELDSLKQQHTSAVDERAQAHSDELDRLKKEHAVALDERSQARSAEVDSLKQQHAAEVEQHSQAHAADLAAVREGFAAEVERAVADLSSRNADEIAALSAKHDEAVEALRIEHSVALEKADAEREERERSLIEGHEATLQEQRMGNKADLAKVQQNHEAALDSLRLDLADERSSSEAALQEKHEAAVSALRDDHSTQVENLRIEHASDLDQLHQQHTSALSTLSAASPDSLKAIEAERDEVKSAHDRLTTQLQELRDDLQTQKVALAASSSQLEASEQRASDLARRYEAATVELATLRQTVKQQQQQATAPSSSHELQEALEALGTLEKALHESQDERERLLTEVQQLKGGEANGRTKYDSIFKDLEQYRHSVTKLDTELVKTRKERDSLSAQLARQSLSSSNAGLGITAQSPTAESTSSFPYRAMSPTQSELERATSPTFRSERFLSNGSTFAGMNGKPPPPTPPPSVPPPPAPLPNAPLPPVPNQSPLRTARSGSTSSTITYGGRRGSGSGISAGETAATSVRSADSQTVDPRVLERFKEQEAQIARLTKQLASKESDLQAQLDLANTLDSALNDSERNLRKARLQSNEYARERDQYKSDNERLRLEAQDSHTTSESYRQSVLDLESRLQHERDVQQRGERARQDLESRMAEVNRRKSKFACF
ncbi:hypothetical protein JCM8097_003635 [Rhodosporidiobolus ruineniae]